MKTKLKTEKITMFPRMVAMAVSRLRTQLQEDYERKYPGLDEIIRIVLEEEEAHAWELSSFPHLFLPDLVEVHIAQLGLEPAETRHDAIVTPMLSSQLMLSVAC